MFCTINSNDLAQLEAAGFSLCGDFGLTTDFRNGDRMVTRQRIDSRDWWLSWTDEKNPDPKRHRTVTNAIKRYK